MAKGGCTSGCLKPLLIMAAVGVTFGIIGQCSLSKAEKKAAEALIKETLNLKADKEAKEFKPVAQFMLEDYYGQKHSFYFGVQKNSLGEVKVFTYDDAKQKKTNFMGSMHFNLVLEDVNEEEIARIHLKFSEVVKSSNDIIISNYKMGEQTHYIKNGSRSKIAFCVDGSTRLDPLSESGNFPVRSRPVQTINLNIGKGPRE